MRRLIIDTPSIVKTCLYAGKDGENGKVVEWEGKPVQVNSAWYGYDNTVNAIVSALEALDIAPSQCIFVLERGNSKIRRRQIYSGYKEGRGSSPPEVNEETTKAVELVSTAFRNLGAQLVCQPHVEADDVIAFLVEKLDGEKVVMSNDGDIAKLLSDSCTLWKGGQLVASNPYGAFETRHITLYKALVGDGDEYKGAVGFGAKAWEQLLEKYGAHLDALEGMIKRRTLHELEDDVESFKPFRKVIDGAAHVYQSYECALLRPEWVDGLRTPLEWKAGMVKPAEDYRLKGWGQQGRIVTCENFDSAVAFLTSKVGETPEFCLDLETTVPEESEEWLAQRTEKGAGVDVFGSTIVSCGLTFGENGQYGLYTSVDHADTDNVTLEQLGRLLSVIPPNKVTISHNAGGFELPVLFNAFGQEWKNNGWRGMFPNMVDSQIAASYWDENQPSRGLKALSKLMLDYDQQSYDQTTTWVECDGQEMWLKDVPDGAAYTRLRQFKMDQLSAKHVFGYGIDDCYTAQGLYNFFKVIMEIEDTLDAFMEVEQKPMYLGAMSFIQGTPISLERLLFLKRQDDEAYPKLEETLHTYLIGKGWEGSLCPVIEELTPASVKQACSILLGQDLQTQVRKVDKLAKLVDTLDHEDAPLLASWIAGGNLDMINAWLKERFEAKPEFNAGSFVQIGKLMYEVMGLPIRLRNKATDAMRAKGIREGNPQTDDDAINLALKLGDATEGEAEALRALLEMKSINTRRGLYWTAYPKFLHWKDNKLHPEIRQCSTNTRRHSGANPNLQQQDSTPGGVRTVIRPHHRDAVFVSLDLAGQEIRLLGDYSGDENITSAYVGDPPKDLHSFTAAMILDVSYDSFRARIESKDEDEAHEAYLARQAGKTTFFASSYGAMAPKIALGLGVEEAVAQSYLDALDKAFPRVGQWKKETEEFASRHGWVPVMGGTRRHLRSLILSDNSYTASKALRQASNARIQGAGGNQIRTIMGRLWDSDVFEKYDARFYWPCHDELCLSVHRDHAVPVIKAVHALMCERFLKTIPSSSSIGIGPNYGDLVEIGEVPDETLILEAVEKCFSSDVANVA